MGATHSSLRPQGMVLPGSYLGELGGEVQYERSMGSSRFLKSIKARHKCGALVVKVFVKSEPQMDLRPTSKRIAAERTALQDCPNLLPYSLALATERAGYLIRQWVSSSLYDRISTRPFLAPIEKKWIVFQLLTALKDMHTRKISHGDIKSENVLVTSWNWVYLSDFSSVFKPTYLPEDDPSDFSLFFDTSGRRTCYLAPERFYTADSEISKKKAGLEFGKRDGRVTEQMDVFALGCVIAELLLEGSPPFTLTQMLRYRSGEYSLEPFLGQIEDDGLKGLVKSMTSLRPSERMSCEEYLSDAYGRIFPESFYDYFHDFVASTNDTSNGTWPSASQFSRSTINAQSNVSGTATPTGTPTAATQAQLASDKPEILPLQSNADEIVLRILADYEIMGKHFATTASTVQSTDETDPEKLGVDTALYPVHLNVLTQNGKASLSEQQAPAEDGPALIVLSLICTSMRNCVRPTSVVRALDILLAISGYLTDETKLDRMLPFVVALLQNDSATVRAAALRTLTQILSLVEVITPANATIFPQYVLPNVLPFASDPDDAVRCLYAQSLASLAESGQRYLDMTQAMKADGTFRLTRAHDYDGSPYEMSYDASLLDLQTRIQDQINILLIDSSSSVKRALVSIITPLCVFLGRARTGEVFSLMTTHLNDKDWLLRAAFFESTVGIATCIGSKGVDEYILPLLTEALADNEESVIARELRSLTTLAELGLYQKGKPWETLSVVIALLSHPNSWIRSGAASFVAASAKVLSQTDVWCTLYPALRNMLKADIETIDELSILQTSAGHLNRSVYEASVAWALRSSKSPFWQPRVNKPQHTLLQMLQDAMRLPLLSEEDKIEMQRLHTLGMSENDSMMLLAMRGYIARVAAVRRSASQLAASEDDNESALSASSQEISLTNHGVTPQTIIFSTSDTLSSRLPSKIHQVESWQRRWSNDMPSRSSSSLDLTRPNAGRSASGTSTADALRRRLVSANHAMPGASGASTSQSPKSAASPRQFPASPSSVVSGAGTSPSETSATTSAEPLEASSATIRPFTTLTKQRSRVNMHGVEITRVSAAIASDMATALGTLTTDGGKDSDSISAMSTPGQARPSITNQDGRRFHSTYDGDDPSIKQLLDRVYLDHYREPMPEFGAHVPARVVRKRSSRTGHARERLHRRPEGTLIAHLVEHTAAITSIAVSPDHLFFATGSEDGTVKVWDSIRLEKNVTSRSRQTIQQGGRITSVVMLENSHCVASASDNGTLWVSRVDVQLPPGAGAVPRYGKQALIRQYAVDSGTGDYATCMLHYDTDSASKLVYSTAQSKIVILDIRTLRSLQEYDNPQHLGPISSICIDRKYAWLIVGTLAGNLSLWDLRFGLLLRTWEGSQGQGKAIISCSVHRSRGKGRWIVVAQEGSDGFEVWDIQSGARVDTFKVVGAGSDSRSATLAEQQRSRASSAATVTMKTMQNEGVKMMAEVEMSPAKAIEALLQVYVTEDQHDIGRSPEQENEGTRHGPETDTSSALHGFRYRSSGPAIRAILTGSDYANSQEAAVMAVSSLPPLSETASVHGPDSRARSDSMGGLSDLGYVITGGEDRKLRFLDLGNIERSSVVCGAEERDERPSYSATKSVSAMQYLEVQPTGRSSGGVGGGGSKAHKAPGLASSQHQTLLKAHQDAIVALALLDLPFRCIISGDRSGVLKVWE